MCSSDLATVAGATGGVTWSVNNIVGGDAVVGSVSPTVVYTAPTAVLAPITVTVRATSVSAPTASGMAAVTILPLPSVTAVTPTQMSAGPFSLTVTGAGFAPGAVVSFDGQPLPTQVVSSTQLTATGNAPTPKASVPVGVATPDGEASNVVFVSVVAAQPVRVSVAPTVSTVRVRQTLGFSVSVTGTTNTAVVWKVNGVVGGASAVGTISAAGVYKAPSQVPSPATVVVSATSAADSSVSATATVTVVKR